MPRQVVRPKALASEDSFLIPPNLLMEFGKDFRIIIRHPWIVGIPIPERLRPDVLKGLTNLEAVVVPMKAARPMGEPLAAPMKDISFVVPDALRNEFAKEFRIVVRYPWIVGIPIPERLRPDVLRGLRDLDVVVAPKELIG